MNIKTEKFGQIDEQNIQLYTLENDNGMTVKITNYGGIVTSIVIPDSKGGSGDIACGFDTLDGYFSDEYKNNAPYFGCLVGRYALCIKDAAFSVDGNEYTVAANDGPNHLHGGIRGFDKRVWNAVATQDGDDCVLTMSLVSEDDEEGYPGRVAVGVEYRLTNNNELRMRYMAETDKATPLSLTNHTYFNLNGFTGKILDHTARIASNKTLVADETNVPVGEEQQVEGTPCDFRTPRKIGKAFEEMPDGFEHYFVFSKPVGQCETVAVFSDESTGRTLEVDTSEPGMLFYTGLYTSDDLKREDGTAFGQFKAFCCEAAKYPNGPNIDGAPDSILVPGQTYDVTTVYRLSW
jgi:aldose 1-epimerase